MPRTAISRGVENGVNGIVLFDAVEDSLTAPAMLLSFEVMTNSASAKVTFLWRYEKRKSGSIDAHLLDLLRVAAWLTLLRAPCSSKQSIIIGGGAVRQDDLA